MSSTVQLTRDGSVAVLTLTDARRRNALSPEMQAGLSSAIDDLAQDEYVRAVVISGSEGVFCAGGDVRLMNELPRPDPGQARRRLQKSQRWINRLIDLDKPVIAAVDGPAFGAGLSLALAADFIVASSRARFCAAFVRMGLVPDLGAMYLLPRAVGLARAKELVFTGRAFGADEALAMGMVQAVVGHESLYDTALQYMRRFEFSPHEAIGSAKTIMNRAFEGEREAMLEREAYAQSALRATPFHQEALRRFVDKKVPVFAWPDTAMYSSETP